MNTKAFVFLPVLILALSQSSVKGQVSVIGELSQDRDAAPGTNYNGSILIKNDTDQPQEAKVYQTDYLFYANGTNKYGEPGSHPRSNAKWITFSPAFVTLPPQASLTINYTVSVPEKSAAPLSGSYWSMLMVEGIPKGSPESSGTRNRKAEMGIMQTIRYGIQVATHITGTGTKTITFKDPKVTRGDAGKRVFQIDIENTGDLAIRPDVYLELFDQQGISQGKFPGVKYRIYPGTSVRETIDLSGIKAGSYKALVVVDAGGEDIFGAQYTLSF